MESKALARKIEALPNDPGVYVFCDRQGQVLYVGKAKRLRQRVRSYFSGQRVLPPRLRALVAKVAEVEILTTSNEKEALIAEANLIKEHRPRYNVVFRDDKNYLALRLHPGERFPRLTLVRQLRQDGAYYFGPFSSAQAVRETLKGLRRVFPLRQCSDRTFKQRRRPCLNYQMGRCLGPCTGLVSAEEYNQLVEQAVLFFRGRTKDLQVHLQQEMERAAAELAFERAARYRDRLQAVRHTLERQSAVSGRFRDQDIVGLHGEESGDAAVAILHVRGGRLLGSRALRVASSGHGAGEILAAFLKQYYGGAADIPREILLSHEVEDRDLLASWLRDRRGGAVQLRVPQRGEGRHLLAMALRNASQELRRRTHEERWTEVALEELRRLLGLGQTPNHLEAVDISNIQGQYAVGSLVSFRDGRPHKPGYRRYRIKRGEGADDPAMIAEVLERRFRRGAREEEIPDLLLIDGGKGQLNRAVAVLENFGMANRLRVAALAKRQGASAASTARQIEHLFLPGRKNPLVLRRNSAACRLLDAVRDEAHRFAIAYYQRRHRKDALQSQLDAIVGLGPKRRGLLLRHFGSVAKLAAAAPEDIAAVPGIGQKLAQQIAASLQSPATDTKA